MAKIRDFEVYSCWVQNSVH